jgi:hypothetical protein
VTAGPSDASAESFHGEFPDVVDDPRAGGSIWRSRPVRIDPRPFDRIGGQFHLMLNGGVSPRLLTETL